MMKFGTQTIPGELFKLARERMLRDTHFEPAKVREHICEHGRAQLFEINSIEKNHQIIAERVMRAALAELVAAGEVEQVKRGLWGRVSKSTSPAPKQ